MLDQRTMFGDSERPLATAKRLAELLGVSDQTIYNWRGDGMPSVRRDGVDMFDIAACRTWASANKGETFKGGKRPGAGRKPRVKSAPAAAAEMVRTVHPVEPVQTFKGAGGGGDEDGDSMPINASSVEELLELAARGELSAAQARRMKDTLGAAGLKLEIEQELGELVKVEDVELEWGSHMRSMRVRLDSMAARITQELRQALELTQEQCGTVRGIVQVEVDRALEALSGSAAIPEKEEAAA